MFNTILNAVVATDGEIAFANTGIWITIILLIIAALAIIVLPVVTTLMQNPKTLIPIVGGVVVLLVIYGIGFGISSDELTPVAIKEGFSHGQFRAVGGAIMTVIILSIIAVFGFIGSAVKDLIK